MGLDICVYNPIKHEDGADEDYVKIITGYEEVYTEKFMEQFGKYIYKKTIETYSMDALKEQYGIDVDNGWDVVSIGGGDDDGTNIRLRNAATEEVREVLYLYKWDVMEEVDVFDAIQVGYQRKGANNKFYEDKMEEFPCICDKATLDQHYKRYFAKEFKDNIMSNFKEGETYVLYC